MMKTLPIACVILTGLWMMVATYDIINLNNRVVKLEKHQFIHWNDSQGNSGIVIDGMMFQCIGGYSTTNGVEE